ncbi:Uncharacterised protein [Staphylococcus aureus]|nr:Uncharacterised protein [Staphylococcus aureus]
MIFLPTVKPKSPLIDPGEASEGLVLPIICLDTLTASSPSTTIANTGADVINEIKSL